MSLLRDNQQHDVEEPPQELSKAPTPKDAPLSVQQTAVTTNPDDPPFTVLSRPEKFVMTILCASVSAFSTMGSPIYYPALGTIEKKFNVSTELVNVSVVVYLLCQGIFPMFVATLADTYGRRPIFQLSLIVFVGASIGLACTNSYPLLLVLRCIQSSGISPTVAIASGCTGDFTQRHERGTFMGLLSGVSLLGQAFGPLIGAGLIAGFDWRAIFWFLAIGGGVSLTLNVLIMPETKRSIVGNGSILPSSIINRSPLLLLPHYRRKWRINNPNNETLAEPVKRDIFATLKILVVPEVAICLLNASLHFALWTCCLTTLTTELDKTYHYSVMTIGLCYLPAGIGGLAGSIVAGRCIDFVYRRLHGRFVEDKKSGKLPKGAEFNITKARIIVVLPFVLISVCWSIVFGWCLTKHVDVAAVCVSNFFVSFGSTSVLNANMTLMVDLYPSNSSAAASCINLTRCLCAALFVGVLTYMTNAMTVGGTLTMMASLALLSAVALILPVKYAQQWKKTREQKQKLKEERQAEKETLKQEEKIPISPAQNQPH